jgi:folate-binding protein YgfZ
MSPQLFHQIEAHGAVVDLSSRAKFRLTGKDRVRFLNGQVTNDVRTSTAERALYACVTDLKGKIVGDTFIHADADSLLIDAEPDLREVLGPRLERYIIADDVELTDVTDEWKLWHVVLSEDASAKSEEIRAWCASHSAVLVRSDRFGTTGIDVWLPVSSSLLPAPCPMLEPADVETLRILRGIPRYPNELNADTFPPEAGLDARAMSYTKGCYIGQEILSRIRTTGKMPRTLVRFSSNEVVAAGNEVLSGDKVVGIITSAAQHPATQQFVGLAFVKHGAITPPLISAGVKLEVTP